MCEFVIGRALLAANGHKVGARGELRNPDLIKVKETPD